MAMEIEKPHYLPAASSWPGDGNAAQKPESQRTDDLGSTLTLRPGNQEAMAQRVGV